MKRFENVAPTDFTIEESRTRFAAALKQVDDELQAGRLYAAPVINGEELRVREEIQSLDPSDSAVVIGRVSLANEADALAAVSVLEAGFPGWRDSSFEERAAVIRRAGDIMLERRDYLSAVIVREAGKPWKEADADVNEAIDFCHYYADEMLRLGPPRSMGSLPGEDNRYFYQPRGIALVIAPWNFPLAIACGMTAAALVTGNATILKPAEQTSIIAFKLAGILLEAGVPKDAFAFLPGIGETVGRALVQHPAVDLICFTGSKAVGLEIIREASIVREGQRNVKKAIAEMGGKNAIIVDEDADLDEAIRGVLHSAFGFAGQKCSACSRVIVVGDAYEPFLERLREAGADILVGKASDPGSFLGPVIDKESCERILNTINEAEKRLPLLFKKQELPEGGYYVPPTAFRDVPYSDPIWKEEIFGPVVACAKAGSLDEAIEIANNSQYALTGGLFSRSPNNIAKARSDFRVGNLYINRGCTGALVYRQPFGGFCMSGVGSKAGGPDYLIQFMEPRAVTENTMRRGFSPDLEV